MLISIFKRSSTCCSETTIKAERVEESWRGREPYMLMAICLPLHFCFCLPTSTNSLSQLLDLRSVSCHTCVLWISWAPPLASSGTSVSVLCPRIPFQAQQLSSSFCCSSSNNIDWPRDRGLPQSLLPHCSLASPSHGKIRRGSHQIHTPQGNTGRQFHTYKKQLWLMWK